ncbi:MAG: threonine--tRNA ligase [Candidatus Kerfeldbacteria bacterium]|nr:threonine--tRNA ligase [Candidatus Kerfeldbacteria bacterium]
MNNTPKASDKQLQNLRHSLAHLLAAAVMELWPDTKRTIGPSIENGFYFDFEFSKPVTKADLPKIEARMRKILPTWTTFARHELAPDVAKKEYPGNPYKHELIDEFSKKGEKITFYKSGAYWDLCRGGHVASMNSVASDCFRLTSVAGAYWRGDEKNPMLTRIYGAAFPTEQELKGFLQREEEAKKRDHKVLGPKLDLFTFSDLVGSGLPLWTPKGTLLRDLLDAFVWELRSKAGYERVEIPHITKKELYERSGHWEKFKDELFLITTREKHLFAMKPMNCPHHTQIFARHAWSYRELPQRYANTTMCYRDEQTGELAGLSRARSFTQDDAHVFCRMAQAKKEFVTVFGIVKKFYSAFGFTLRIRLSLHDPKHADKYLGDAKRWQQAEKMLRDIANEQKADFFEGIGEAAFYGPKLDFMAMDSLGREWQVATIQLDMNMPERFNLSCTNENGKEERIVMIHAAIMGSIERFLSILIEHTAGSFPVWLAPIQVQIVPVGSRHTKPSEKLAKELRDAGIRVDVDDANETVGYKIRKAMKLKIPYLLVIGDKEAKATKLSVRVRGSDRIRTTAKKRFIEKLRDEIAKRK